VVPSQAVQTGQNGEFVFVVLPDRTVTNKAVTTSVTTDGSTVIAAGVNPGDTVVTDGQLRLVPGARVSFKPASPPDVSTNALATSEQK
jgi:multidrug efflux system membrane fusion protein